MVEGEDNIPRTFLPSLKLKIKQLQIYRVGVTIFYVSEIMREGYSNIISPSIDENDEYGPILVEAYLSVLQFFSIIYIFWGFRPRKEWPEFFTLGVDQFLYRLQPGNQVGR